MRVEPRVGSDGVVTFVIGPDREDSYGGGSGAMWGVSVEEAQEVWEKLGRVLAVVDDVGVEQAGLAEATGRQKEALVALRARLEGE